MSIVDLKYYLWRILNMTRYKGLSYAFNYFKVVSIYNSNFVYEKIISHLPSNWFYPQFIEVEVSTYCPLRCIMCEHTYWREKNKNMSLNQLKSIVEQFPKLCWIGLTGIGESFSNPEFVKMIEYVKGKNLYLELYDNFFLINNLQAQALIVNGVDRMIVSLDAASKETYAKIRPGADFNRVIENIKNLRILKRKFGKFYPEIIFHYIISKYNLTEVLPFLTLVKKIMGREKTSVLFTGVLHEFPQVSKLTVQIPEDLVKKVEKKAKNLGIRISWNRNVPQYKDPIYKCNEWLMPFIFVDGTVIPCCAANEANKRDFQRATSMGNIFETPFKKIWNGPKYVALRSMILAGKTPSACQNCTIYYIDCTRQQRNS
jgi:MoaA/NifB/PqqE/SkfB family radical SAM enzyme